MTVRKNILLLPYAGKSRRDQPCGNSNDGHGNKHNHPGKNTPHGRNRHQVSVPDRTQRFHGKPERVKKGTEFLGLGIMLCNINSQGSDVQHEQDHGEKQKKLIPDQVESLFKTGGGFIKPGQLENSQYADNPQGIKNLPVRPEKHAQERHADNKIQNTHAAENISLPRFGAQHPQDILKHEEIADPVIHLGRDTAYQRMNIRNGIQRVQHEPYQNQYPDNVLPGTEIGSAQLGAGNLGHGGN